MLFVCSGSPLHSLIAEVDHVIRFGSEKLPATPFLLSLDTAHFFLYPLLEVVGKEIDVTRTFRYPLCEFSERNANGIFETGACDQVVLVSPFAFDEFVELMQKDFFLIFHIRYQPELLLDLIFQIFNMGDFQLSAMGARDSEHAVLLYEQVLDIQLFFLCIVNYAFFPATCPVVQHNCRLYPPEGRSIFKMSPTR